MSDNKNVFTLADAAKIVYLNGENAKFYKNSDFLGAELTLPDEEENLKTEKHERVWLHRSFPFNMPEEYISVQNKDQEELALIKSLSDLPDEAAALVREELERKYYTPKLKKILTLKETRGFSFWQVLTDAGELSFTLQDTSRSIAKISEDRAFIFDICGNRYEIESLKALDKKSYRKLELYL